MTERAPSRRALLGGAVALGTAARPLAASSEAAAIRGRLLARPVEPPRTPPAGPGVHKLGLGEARDGLLFVPEGHDARSPTPLVIMLHGAGGVAGHVMPMLQGVASQPRSLVLAPDSRAPNTWDVIRGAYGPDVQFMDRALGYVFERHSVDPRHIAIGGFSDGASYALSIGLTNGDFLGDILAFSPGFAAPSQTAGKPRIFISHGDKDEVLPVDRCGRRLARELARAGYDVDYREFAGGHVVPPDLVEAAMTRFLA